jgi:hypothetical protein
LEFLSSSAFTTAVETLPRNTMGKVQKNLLRERFADAYSTANLSASAAHKQAIIWQPRRLRDRSAIPASQFVMSAFWQRPIALLI